MSKKYGTLYGIGVGPGDPDLMTLKAVKILKRVDIVFTAASTKNGHSLALSIAKNHIPRTTAVTMLRFPMTRDQGKTHLAWQENAKTIIAELESGKDVAFLTLGDSMTYSTFGYIARQVQREAPHLKIETVPGIASYQAAAARLNLPLVEGEESLIIVSGAAGGNRLRQLSRKPENIVFLKAYRNVKDITEALNEAGSFQQCVAVKNCGHANEEIIRNVGELNECQPDYWTLIIAKQNKANDFSNGSTEI